jgi:hypothetical protein
MVYSKEKPMITPMIIQKAKSFYDKMKITDKCTLSEGWLQNLDTENITTLTATSTTNLIIRQMQEEWLFKAYIIQPLSYAKRIQPVKQIHNLQSYLQLSKYHSFHQFISQHDNGKQSSQRSEKPLGFVFTPCITAFSEKFKHMRNQYNIRTNFKTNHTCMSSFM